jgi:hypothetical protein
VYSEVDKGVNVKSFLHQWFLTFLYMLFLAFCSNNTASFNIICSNSRGRNCLLENVAFSCTLNSPYACKHIIETKSTTSFGSVFMILLLIAVFIYLVIGIIYAVCFFFYIYIYIYI